MYLFHKKHDFSYYSPHFNYIQLLVLYQAITALAHLRAAVLYFMDISEQCGHHLDEQLELFKSICPLFANKPVVVVLNKVDVLTFDDLPEDKKTILKYFEQEGSCPV